MVKFLAACAVTTSLLGIANSQILPEPIQSTQNPHLTSTMNMDGLNVYITNSQVNFYINYGQKYSSDQNKQIQSIQIQEVQTTGHPVEITEEQQDETSPIKNQYQEEQKMKTRIYPKPAMIPAQFIPKQEQIPTLMNTNARPVAQIIRKQIDYQQVPIKIPNSKIRIQSQIINQNNNNQKKQQIGIELPQQVVEQQQAVGVEQSNQQAEEAVEQQQDEEDEQNNQQAEEAVEQQQDEEDEQNNQQAEEAVEQQQAEEAVEQQQAEGVEQSNQQAEEAVEQQQAQEDEQNNQLVQVEQTQQVIEQQQSLTYQQTTNIIKNSMNSLRKQQSFRIQSQITNQTAENN